MKKKAIKLLKDALDSKTPIRYSTIQKETGLSKEEIDKLIEDFPKIIQDAKDSAKKTKEMQAKWYEEHYEQLYAQRVRHDFMTLCDEVD